MRLQPDRHLSSRAGRVVRWACVTASLLIVMLLPVSAAALDDCEARWSEPVRVHDGTEVDALEALFTRVKRDAAAQLHDKVATFGLGREAPADLGFMPFAVFDRQDRGWVVVDPSFLEPLCVFVAATFLSLEAENTLEDIFQPAFDAAKACYAREQDAQACLDTYVSELATTVRPKVRTLGENEARTITTLTNAAMYQVLSHELAHLVFAHRDEEKAGRISRLDAEFQADFYAIMAANHVGEPPSGLYYVFEPLRIFVLATGTGKTGIYETYECRAKNINDALDRLGAASLFFRAMSIGEFDPQTMEALEEIVTSLTESLDEPAEDFGCGKLKEDLFREAQAEFVEVGKFLLNAQHLFAAQPQENQDLRAQVAFEDTRIVETLLQQMDQSDHLAPTYAMTLSFYLQRATQSDGFDIADSLTDRVLAAMQAKASSHAYGRTLAAFGVHYIEDLEDATGNRRARALLREATRYNPTISEAHGMLGMMEYYGGNCTQALSDLAQAYYSAAAEAARDQSLDIYRIVETAAKTPDSLCKDQ